MSLRLVCSAFVVGSMLVPFTAKLPAADAQADDLVQQIVKLIGDNDREFRAAGLEQVRTAAHGANYTQLFAAQLPKLNAEGQIALLDALADRGDNAARPAVLELIGSGSDKEVKAAAIAALGRLGTIEDLPLLIKTIADGSKSERVAARQALTQMRGTGINASLVDAFQSAPAKAKSALVEVLATRRAAGELPLFVSASTDDNVWVRRAGMSALAQLGRPDQIPQMLPGVLRAEKGGERDDAEKSVATICDRIENEDQRATAVIDALNAVDATHRDELLSLAGRVGGNKLLNYVAAVATGPDIARRQLGIDALSKWPDASVADKLFEIATNASDPKERDAAFRGFVKVSAARDHRSDKERLARLKQAMTLAKTPEQAALVINRVRTAYDIDALRLVGPYMDQPQFAQLACETIVEIAHHREVRDPNKAEVDKILDKVIATSKDPIVVERANRYKRGETWDRRSSRTRR